MTNVTPSERAEKAWNAIPRVPGRDRCVVTMHFGTKANHIPTPSRGT